MPERLTDHDPAKWDYHAHTGAKHRILARYLSGWIPILARAAQAFSNQRVRLMLIDGFAGRGRYTGGEAGSPLIIANLAEQVISYLGAHGHEVEIDCHFVEADRDNHQQLTEELRRTRPHISPGVALRDPILGSFESTIRPLLARAQQCSGLFVFADPFGFGNIPLSVMREILAVPRGEVFITYMVQYVNRFFDEADRDRAFGVLFGVAPSELMRVRERLGGAHDRELLLRDYYMERLKQGAGARYTWAFRMLPEHGDTTLYYLIHASTHPRALRLMKDTMKTHGTQGEYAFYGRQDFARQQQLLLIPQQDTEALKQHLATSQAGTSIAYEALLNLLCDQPECYYSVDDDIRRALQDLRQEGRIDVTPVTSKTARGLKGQDLLAFPAPPRLPRVAPPPVISRPPTAVQPRLF